MTKGNRFGLSPTSDNSPMRGRVEKSSRMGAGFVPSGGVGSRTTQSGVSASIPGPEGETCEYSGRSKNMFMRY